MLPKPVEIRKNWQDQTTSSLNNQRIRENWFGPHRSKPCLQCTHLATQNALISHSAFLPSICQESVLFRTSKKSLTFPIYIYLSPPERFHVSAHGTLQCRHCTYKDLDLNADPETSVMIGYN